MPCVCGVPCDCGVCDALWAAARPFCAALLASRQGGRCRVTGRRRMSRFAPSVPRVEVGTQGLAGGERLWCMPCGGAVSLRWCCGSAGGVCCPVWLVGSTMAPAAHACCRFCVHDAGRPGSAVPRAGRCRRPCTRRGESVGCHHRLLKQGCVRCNMRCTVGMCAARRLECCHTLRVWQVA
jgi:hypothetical protein